MTVPLSRKITRLQPKWKVGLAPARDDIFVKRKVIIHAIPMLITEHIKLV